MKKDNEKAKENIEKETIIIKKDKFRCKKCGQFKPIGELRSVIVTQRNRPMEFNHVTFSSKADVPICNQCYKIISRG